MSKINFPDASRHWSLSRLGSTTHDATAIPVSEPIGLKDCERLSRRVEVSFDPSERMKGLAVVSRKARPKVRMYSEKQKKVKLCRAAAGMKRKAPTAYSDNPSRMPLL